jgi:hypothetical protein
LGISEIRTRRKAFSFEEKRDQSLRLALSEGALERSRDHCGAGDPSGARGQCSRGGRFPSVRRRERVPPALEDGLQVTLSEGKAVLRNRAWLMEKWRVRPSGAVFSSWV